jgi:two-component system response regulator RegA
MTNKSLLIVDDEPAIRMIVARLAQSCGFQVTEAGCAGEALDRMAESPAAIALCDIGMPDRDGLWLAGQLRQQFPNTAVVMFTGYGDARREASLAQGAIGYLSKPFSRKELIDMLDEAVRWRRERAEAGAWDRPPLGLPAHGLADVVQLEPAVKTPSI